MADNEAVDSPLETPEVDPREFLHALLHIDPKDAERVRDDSPATRPRKPPEGPHHGYGEERR